MFSKIKLKKAKMVLISVSSFALGGYLLWIAFSVFMGFDKSQIDNVDFKLVQPIPSRLRGEDLRIFLLSLGGGIGAIINGLWYAAHIHRPETFD